MHGVPKLPRINPGTALNNPDLVSVIPEDEIEQFKQLSTDELWNLEYKYDVKINDVFGPGRFALESSLDALVILNWRRDGSPTMFARVDLNQRRDLLEALMKSPGLFYQPDEPEPEYSEDDYIQRLTPTAVFEISGRPRFSEGCGRDSGKIKQSLAVQCTGISEPP